MDKVYQVNTRKSSRRYWINYNGFDAYIDYGSEGQAESGTFVIGSEPWNECVRAVNDFLKGKK